MELSHHKAWVIILGILILAIATVVSAYIGILPELKEKPIEQTQTIIAIQQTQIALTPSITSSSPENFPSTPEIRTNIPINQTNSYSIIDLSNIPNAEYWSSNLGLNAGQQTLNNIFFDYGWNVETSGCSTNSINNVILATNLTSPIAVHILIQSGHANYTYEGDEIGNVEIHFDSGEQLTEPLILGFNIRSWTRDDSGSVETITADYVEEVISARGIGDGRLGGFDIITIEIPPEYQNSILAEIRINDTSETTMNARFADPCIHIHGITVETS